VWQLLLIFISYGGVIWRATLEGITTKKESNQATLINVVIYA